MAIEPVFHAEAGCPLEVARVAGHHGRRVYLAGLPARSQQPLQQSIPTIVNKDSGGEKDRTDQSAPFPGLGRGPGILLGSPTRSRSCSLSCSLPSSPSISGNHAPLSDIRGLSGRTLRPGDSPPVRARSPRGTLLHNRTDMRLHGHFCHASCRELRTASTPELPPVF